VDYVAYPEYELVQSNLATGSMSTSYQQRLIAYHAVAREGNGMLRKTTECGLLYAFPPNAAEPIPWLDTYMMKRCQECVDTAGGEMRTPDGRRYKPPGI
jgi:hypothetical protein